VFITVSVPNPVKQSANAFLHHREHTECPLQNQIGVLYYEDDTKQMNCVENGETLPLKQVINLATTLLSRGNKEPVFATTYSARMSAKASEVKPGFVAGSRWQLTCE
jgi:hypothetical protein